MLLLETTKIYSIHDVGLCGVSFRNYRIDNVHIMYIPMTNVFFLFINTSSDLFSIQMNTTFQNKIQIIVFFNARDC